MIRYVVLHVWLSVRNRVNPERRADALPSPTSSQAPPTLYAYRTIPHKRDSIPTNSPTSIPLSRPGRNHPIHVGRHLSYWYLLHSTASRGTGAARQSGRSWGTDWEPRDTLEGLGGELPVLYRCRSPRVYVPADSRGVPPVSPGVIGRFTDSGATPQPRAALPAPAASSPER